MALHPGSEARGRQSAVGTRHRHGKDATATLALSFAVPPPLNVTSKLPDGLTRRRGPPQQACLCAECVSCCSPPISIYKSNHDYLHLFHRPTYFESHCECINHLIQELISACEAQDQDVSEYMNMFANVQILIALSPEFDDDADFSPLITCGADFAAVIDGINPPRACTKHELHIFISFYTTRNFVRCLVQLPFCLCVSALRLSL